MRFFRFEELSEQYADVGRSIGLGESVLLTGLSPTHKALIASCIDAPVLYLTADYYSAQEIAAAIAALTGEKAVLLPAKDEVLFYKDAISKDNLFLRTVAIDGIFNGAKFTVCPIEAFLQPIPTRAERLVLQRDEDSDVSAVCDQLVKMGYKKEFKSESRGTFALRGDLLEVFPVNAEHPYRVDFFGDTVEKIRGFDAETGERLQEEDCLTVISATDVYIDREESGKIAERINRELRAFKTYAAKTKAQAIADDILQKLPLGSFTGASFLLPLLKSCTDLASVLPENTVVLYDEPKKIDEAAAVLTRAFHERMASLYESGEVFAFSQGQMLSYEEELKNLRRLRGVGLMQFASDSGSFSALRMYNLHSNPIASYRNDLAALSADVTRWLASGYRVICYCDSEQRKDAVEEMLAGCNIPLQSVKEYRHLSAACVRVSPLQKGLVLFEEKLAIVGVYDLFAKRSREVKIRRKRGNLFIAPEIGDFVVHDLHGVGRLCGMKMIETLEGTKEYMSVEYRDGDMLYIPVEQMGSLSKYVGEENPQLNRFGGAEFARVKERVRNSIKQMSFDLKKLYAERQEQKGFCFPENADMMDEFEEAFEYEDTVDQKCSVEEIKKDMCSPKVMDRLVCGDVGYGKTEVALRAIYLCVLAGKQAALMCPSTVLCEQHLNTANKRFKHFGLRIARLNRFCSPSEVEKTLQGLQDGTVDLVIGTHRLLSKDVRFANLGLLVLDEEQRFGVEHKEKIKLLKRNVDCLTLSATPIPRTLHMSLAGIRDISNINTPPVDRLPVQTYIVEESEALIRDACIREIARGGQVFILYNRVASIRAFADSIAKIVPEATVTVGHGQMEKSVFERNVFGFYRGESNVLVSTTIIENGIDLPNANTIIVIDSDRLGISQLYQLKGRVGRSNRLAYAYFTYKSEKVLTETATQRLRAMMEFTELGAGFKLAMRDLEIRGAGDVLGRDQHGHMDKIGYELYSKILKEEMSGERITVPELDIRATAYIPEGYVGSSSVRLDAYKQIAEIADLDDFKRIVSSLEDSYGELPVEVKNLLSVAVLKAYAQRLGVKRVSVGAKGGLIVFASPAAFGDEKIRAALDRYDSYVSLTMIGGAGVEFKKSKNPIATMGLMTKFLKFALSFGGIA